MKTTDVGSLPLEGDRALFLRGAAKAKTSKQKLEEKELSEVAYFEEKVLRGLIDKLRAGIEIPTYPQFRDMNEMFLEMMQGVAKLREGYVLMEQPTVVDGRIPEVYVIKEHAKEIAEAIGQPFKIRVCVTGPHTLSRLFVHRSPELFTALGEALKRIAEDTLFKTKHGETAVLTLDEPLLGVVDDHLLDYGSTGRENLLKAWEKIYSTATEKGIRTCMHLHSTTEKLFWQTKNLKTIESHVDDPIYKKQETKQLLKQNEKQIVATICHTQYDQLIKTKIKQQNPKITEEELAQKIGEAWTKIRKNQTDPTKYLETKETMQKRLKNLIKTLGKETIALVGPECGLGGFPNYKTAIKYLKTLAEATKTTLNP